MSSLKLLLDYLANHQQRTKVDFFFSSWEDILPRLPQGSILDPLLLNVFMCHMFLILKTVYFTSYANNNNSFAVANNIEYVTQSIEEVNYPMI